MGDWGKLGQPTFLYFCVSVFCIFCISVFSYFLYFCIFAFFVFLYLLYFCTCICKSPPIVRVQRELAMWWLWQSKGSIGICLDKAIDIVNKPFETVRQKEPAKFENIEIVFHIRKKCHYLWSKIQLYLFGADNDYGEEKMLFDFSVWCLKHKVLVKKPILQQNLVKIRPPDGSICGL